MAAAKVLFESFRFTVIRRNDRSIEIVPKDDPRKARTFRTLESDILDAYYRDGFAGVDRLCDRLLAG
jgi:hypothetical protein